MQMKKIFDWIIGKRHATPSPELDIVEEVNSGKLILVDSGVHSPLQYWLKEIPMWDEFFDQKTVEIRSWSSTYSQHPNFKKLISSRDGELTIRADKMIYLDSYEIPQPIFGSDYIRDGNLAKRLADSIQSVDKTVIRFEYNKEQEIAKIESILHTCIDTVQGLIHLGDDLPLFLIEIGDRYDTPTIQRLIHDLHDLGPSIVVIRLVTSPRPISAMDADIHIIERTPFLDYLHADSEALLKSGEYVTVTPYPVVLNKNFAWGNKKRQRPSPSIDEYNADPEGYKSRFRIEEL